MESVVWLDEQGKTFVVKNYKVKNIDGKYVFYAQLDNGEIIPVWELKEKYKKEGTYYI